MQVSIFFLEPANKEKKENGKDRKVREAVTIAC